MGQVRCIKTFWNTPCIIEPKYDLHKRMMIDAVAVLLPVVR